MKAVMITFDSLNRRFLSPYGCEDVQTPNFDRLAQRCLTFERCYVGSLPCMPARRELHTGRYNFLHRSWGPLEPFDDSMPEVLKQNGIHSHLTSDHGHYWEDGGCTYHTRYSTWEFYRGQEGDPWMAQVGEVSIPPHLGQLWRQDVVNRGYITEEAQQPQSKTFEGGIRFLENNHAQDQWFLHIETFDPHEPFYVMPEYRALYEKSYEGPLFDWPNYAPVAAEERPYAEHLRNMYRALVTMCDRSLGKILDLFDAYRLWQDTLLIVNTDHGFLLGEHDWWAKDNQVNLYDEVTRIPLFIYHPEMKKTGRCDALVQTIDLPATILDFFGLPIPKDMLGHPLAETMATGCSVRETALYGVHGAQIACTDGGHTYILAPRQPNQPLYNYTLMPTHMRARFPVEELQGAEFVRPFSFTKGCSLIKTRDYDHIGRRESDERHEYQTLLFDMVCDPGQTAPIEDAKLERYFREQIACHLRENDAPMEQYTRMELPQTLVMQGGT